MTQSECCFITGGSLDLLGLGDMNDKALRDSVDMCIMATVQDYFDETANGSSKRHHELTPLREDFDIVARARVAPEFANLMVSLKVQETIKSHLGQIRPFDQWMLKDNHHTESWARICKLWSRLVRVGRLLSSSISGHWVESSMRGCCERY
jgi:hypothetical protein